MLISLELFFERHIKVKGTQLHKLPIKKNYIPFTLECCYCGERLHSANYTKDHLIPKCQLGNDSIHNVKPCCFKCNQHKGDHGIYAYIEYLIRMKAPKWKIDNAKRAFYGEIFDLL